MFFSDKKNYGAFLFFTIAVFLSIIFFSDRISLFPSFVHAWTQSDRYALALGFLNNGFDFFHPQTFNLLTKDGITQVDFPIHEYLAAIIMKLTGIHQPVVFRIYILVYGLIGLYFVFKLAKLFGGNFLHGMLASVFMMTCPVFTYYLDGFLPSIPSFSNLMIGYYFFFRYKNFHVNRDFTIAICFFTLAALARTPFVIFLVAVGCQQYLEYLRAKKINWKELIILKSGFIVIILYVLYNLHLAHLYGSQFLLTILPAKSLSEFREVFSRVLDQWTYDYFTMAHYIMLLGIAAFIIFLFVRKKISAENKFAAVHIRIAFSGTVLYFILMATQFPEHDYYFIDSFYPVIALLLVYWIPKIPARSALEKYFFAAGSCVIIYFFSADAMKVLDNRYKAHEWDRTEITRQNFTGAEAFLDSTGIPKTSKMLVLDAYTTNTPLILMNRKGYTLLWTSKEKVDSMLRLDYDYVVMQNCFVVSDIVHFDPEIIPQLEKIADNGSISIYKKQEDMNRSLDDFLGITEKNVIYRCNTDFEKDSLCLPVDLSKRTTDKAAGGNYSLLIEPGDEFTPTFRFIKNEIPFGKSTKVLIRARILREDVSKDADIVVSLGRDDQNYFYRNFSLRQYIGKAAGWQNCMFQFVIPEIKSEEDKLSLYFWNKEKGKFYMDDLEVVLYK